MSARGYPQRSYLSARGLAFPAISLSFAYLLILFFAYCFVGCVQPVLKFSTSFIERIDVARCQSRAAYNQQGRVAPAGHLFKSRRSGDTWL